MIRIESLTKTYAGFNAVDDVSSTARPGRVTGFLADDLVVIGHGRIVAQGTKAELLAGAGNVVRAAQGGALTAALAAAGSEHTVAPDGAVLAAADSAGLDEMFLELTASTQRQAAAA